MSEKPEYPSVMARQWREIAVAADDMLSESDGQDPNNAVRLSILYGALLSVSYELAAIREEMRRPRPFPP